jgi:hypothetical protein
LIDSLPSFCQNKCIVQGAGIPPVLYGPKVANSMVVEWLKVKMDPALQSQYPSIGRKIWTALLVSRSGFVSPFNPVTPDDRVIAGAPGSGWQQLSAALLEATAAPIMATLGQALLQVEIGEHPVSED